MDKGSEEWRAGQLIAFGAVFVFLAPAGAKD